MTLLANVIPLICIQLLIQMAAGRHSFRICEERINEERAKRNETRMPIDTVSIQHYLEVLANAIK